METMYHGALLSSLCPLRVPHTLKLRWPRSHRLSCSLMMKSLYSSTLFSVFKCRSISRWNSVASGKGEVIKDELGQLLPCSLNFSESVRSNRRFQFSWNNVLWVFFMCQVSSTEGLYPGPVQHWSCHHGLTPPLLKSRHRWPSTYVFPDDGLPVLREMLHAQKMTESACFLFCPLVCHCTSKEGVIGALYNYVKYVENENMFLFCTVYINKRYLWYLP